MSAWMQCTKSHEHSWNKIIQGKLLNANDGSDDDDDYEPNVTVADKDCKRDYSIITCSSRHGIWSLFLLTSRYDIINSKVCERVMIL